LQSELNTNNFVLIKKATPKSGLKLQRF
jgi:hypothetical protein